MTLTLPRPMIDAPLQVLGQRSGTDPHRSDIDQGLANAALPCGIGGDRLADNGRQEARWRHGHGLSRRSAAQEP